MQAVMGTLTVLFFGLGVVIFLLQFLRQLFSRIPLLIINDEGIQYFCPFLLETIERDPMTHWNIALKWKELARLVSLRGNGPAPLLSTPLQNAGDLGGLQAFRFLRAFCQSQPSG